MKIICLLNNSAVVALTNKIPVVVVVERTSIYLSNLAGIQNWAEPIETSTVKSLIQDTHNH